MTLASHRCNFSIGIYNKHQHHKTLPAKKDTTNTSPGRRPHFQIPCFLKSHQFTGFVGYARCLYLGLCGMSQLAIEATQLYVWVGQKMGKNHG